MDGQTLTLVENIAEALEDRYGEMPSRYILELTFGTKIGLAIADLVDIARAEGGRNANIPGYVLTSDGGYVTADDEVKRLVAMGVPWSTAHLNVVDPRYRSTVRTVETKGCTCEGCSSW